MVGILKSWSATGASNTTAATGIPVDNGTLFSSDHPASRSIMAAIKALANQLTGAKTTGGSANAQTFTSDTSGAISTAYAAGMAFRFKAGYTNTATCTLNVDGVGAKTIKKGALQAALDAGDIVAGGIYLVTYEASGDCFVLDNPTTGVSGNAALRGWITGLVPSNNGSDAVNDIDISAGAAMAADNTAIMVLAASLTKRIDASWAVGTGNGGLDGTESSAGTPDTSTWYFLWLIQRSDTGVVDALFSESVSSPTMPSNYDRKRLIGAVYNNSSADIDAFTAIETAGGGLDVLYATSILSIDIANTLTTTARTDVIRVPLGLKADALLNIHVADASSSAQVYVSSPDVTDVAPSTSAAPLYTANMAATAIGAVGAPLRIRTNTSGQVRSRANLATVDAYRAAVLGYGWSRR